MFGHLRALIYGSTPATFNSPFPVEHAVSRLRAATSSSLFGELIRQSANGKVTAQRVVLERDIPFVGNSFKPVFVGRFESKEGRTVLTGAFRLSWFARTFMSFWFGFGVLWTVFAIVGALANPSEAWFFPLAGCGLLLAGFLLVSLGKWFARNDEAYLSKVIAAALAGAA